MYAEVFLVLASPFVGSFLGLATYRLPRGLPWVTGRSRCPACGTNIGWRELIPVLGWFLSRGRCRSCRTSIDRSYPIIETAAVVVALWSVAHPNSHAPWMLAVIGWALLLASAIDLRHFLLPDVLTLFLAASGLAVAALWQPETFVHSLIGGLVGVAVGWAGAVLYRVVRGRDGLGLGDAKLFGAAGTWVAWSGLPSVLLFASVSALLYVAVLQIAGRKIDGSTAIPFGPFLALGTWLVILYGPVVPAV